MLNIFVLSLLWILKIPSEKRAFILKLLWTWKEISPVIFLLNNENTFSIFFSVFLYFSNGNPIPNKAWFNPKYIKVGTDQLQDYRVITCHQSFTECTRVECLYKWRIEHNIMKEASTEKYELVNDGRTLLIKPPLSTETHADPFACVIEANGRPLGEAVSKIIFLGKIKVKNMSVL